MPEQHADYDVVFRSKAVADGDLFLRSVHGREALNVPYELHLALVTSFGQALGRAELDDLLAQPARIAFGRAEEHAIHGVLRELTYVGSQRGGAAVYEAILVPQVWYRSLAFGSRAHIDRSVIQIAKWVLEAGGLEEGKHFEKKLVNEQRPHAYTVQYQESDLAFVSRLLEREGYFYFFEQTPDGEKLVIADSNSPCVPLDGHEVLTYDDRQGTTDLAEVVTDLGFRQRVLPKRLALRYYNYRTPSLPLRVEDELDSAGHGRRVVYGEHFPDLAEAARVWSLRAEQLVSTKEVYSATTRVRGLRAGMRFRLQGHPIQELDREYLVIAIEHSVTQAPPGVLETEPAGYSNRLTAIPYEVPYRPPLVTPIPRIFGVMHAHIDGPEGLGTPAPLDEQGRYKVLMPWDLAGEGGGNASRWLRMMQPSNGPGYGVHLPLHIGTEVLVAHLDGDPDRPVIAGSVPNTENPSPVTGANATQSVIRTRSGITVRWDDDA